uniref:UmuC domain-containing protein n=1 Tax=Macrostomum lignano TaxID=282301 RepID=A0A1I8IJP5_9PLAT
SEKASCGSLHQSWSEVASCSYAARACGVRNGMLLGRARELCPELVAVPYEFEAYEAASSQLYRLLGEFTHSLQAVSCDELFVDCGELLRETGASPAQLASLVRKEVQERTGGCTARPSRTASGAAGPGRDRRTAARPAGPRTARVGRALEARLTSLGFGTCGLLRGAQVSALGRELGPRVAQTLLDAANGRDDRPVLAERERKSISAEINYGAMMRRPDAPQETAKFGGHGVCNTVNKSVALPLDTDDARLLLQECMIIVRQLRLAPQDMRGLGIHMTRLVPATTGSGGSGSSGGGGRSMDISRFAKKVNPFAASGSAASSLSGATSSSMSGATSGFMSGATSGSMSVATSGSMSGATSGSMSGATSGSMPGATSGSMSGATSGSMSGVTSGSMSGATSGSMSGATSGSMSGATSGSMSGATSGSMSFSSASGTSSSNTFGGPSGATSGASGASGAKLLGRKASSNCYSNDRNKVTGKANFFANAAGPSLIEDEEGDERADSPAVPSAADCTQYDLSSALFDSGAPQIDEDFLAALPDSMATAIRAQLRDRDQNRDRDQDRDQPPPSSASPVWPPCRRKSGPSWMPPTLPRSGRG